MAEPTLYARMEVRLADAEKKLAKFQSRIDGDMGKIERRTKKAAATMDAELSSSFGKVTTVFKGFAAGIVGGIAAMGVGGVVSTFRDVAASVAEIGDQAKIAGVNVKAFQELKYVAEQNRIGVDALTDGLKEMSLRADEFIVSLGKSGSGAEAFKRLGYDAEALKEKLKDPSALFAEIIGRLQKLDKAAQIRIADEIFGGTGGERFVQLIDQGEKGIRDTISAANDLGIVIDEQLIERAAEVDKRFNQIANTVGSALKSAIVSAADSMAEFLDGWRQFENQRTSTLENRQIENAKQRLDLENRILDLQSQQRDNPAPERLSGVARDLGFEGSKNEALAGYTGQIEAARAELKALADDDAKITGILNNRIQPMNRTADRTWTPPPPSTSGNSGGGRDKSAASTEREADAVRRLIGELESELQLVGATDLERETANALRQAGASATDDQRAKIVALVAALHAEEEASRNASDASMELRDIGRDVVGGLVQDLRSGKSAADALAGALDKVVDRLLNIGLDSLLAAVTRAAASSAACSASSALPTAELLPMANR